ncbi:C4-dicarboxylate-binding protein DctP [Marinobacter gudaonensis]|uniref:C4-dicarboxylate-binding protein DctP n=1 Tax=Marinobacter gudaonensis TaxID=375760 RepID=A0A1I6HP41_9GAMM|nr:DctP family TRAP transporter solute-binding subunit [Marinobacter gudaonensis]SFR56127.1 C4-dicarboxylate-binding protein DctP [Marinobacter gudaonensis]
MKIIRALTLGLLAGFASNSTFAEPTKLIFSHVVGPNTPKGKMAVMFKDIVEEKLPGRFEVVIYEKASLMSDVEAVDAIAEGRIHFAAPALSKFTNYTSKLKVFDLPFMFPDMESVTSFQEGFMGRLLLTSMSDDNILGLGYLQNGLKQLTATTHFSEPGDLQGRRFRIIDTDVLKDQFLALGAEPVPIPWPQTFDAIRAGQVDGQENTWSNIYSSEFYRYQPHMMASNHGVLGYMLITSQSFWTGLKQEERRLLSYALDVALQYGNAVATAKSINDKEELRTMRGIELLEPTKEQLATWRQVMVPIWQKYESAIGKSIVDAARKHSGG